MAPRYAPPNRRSVLAGAAGVAALATQAFARAPKSSDGIIVNGLGGMGNPNGAEPTDAQKAAHYLDPRGYGDTISAGVSAINLTLGHVFGEGDPFVETVEDIAWWDAAIRKRPDALVKVFGVDDIVAAKATGRVGVVYGFQNTEMLGDDIDRVGVFADLGVRIVQLTYNLQNAVGAGSLVEENTGLTDFGREVVAALNAKKLLVDLSHAGEKTTWDALEASSAPIAITHTGCAALAPHPRNKTDAELRALADKGGVAGIYFMPYLTPGRQQTAADIVAHIKHAVNVCGEDHVGIGTDQSTAGIDDLEGYRARHRADVENRKRLGVGAPNESADILVYPPDLMGAEQYRKLADLLSAEGYTSARLDKILGGNFMRLFREVW